MKIIPKMLAGSALISLLVFAAEIPEALPAGFLEQLPVMLEMSDAEYEAFLAFSQQQLSADEKARNTQGRNTQGEDNDDQ